jgi:hypothetical protein
MKHNRTLAIALLVGAALVSGVGYLWGTNKAPTAITAQGPTRTPSATPTATPSATATPTQGPWHTQIESEGDAILWVLTEWWPEINAEDYAGRLVSVATMETFLGMTDEARTADTPVWIVGVLNDDPLPQNVLRGPGITATGSALNTAAGVYYVFTANDGLMITSGFLYDETAASGLKYSALLVLNKEEIDIVTPSPAPTYSAPPNPTPDT